MDRYEQAMASVDQEERRLKLTVNDLEVLCQGDELLRDGVHVILEDGGLFPTLTAVRRGLTEAARRLRERAHEEDACPSCRGTRRVPAYERPELVGTMPCPDCTKRFDLAEAMVDVLHERSDEAQR